MPDANFDLDRPFERQPGESEQAYEAWQIYRDLGVSRSLEAVSQVLARSLPTIKVHSARWSWVERARLWDNRMSFERDRVRARYAAIQEKRRLKSVETNYDIANEIRSKALIMLRWPLTKQEKNKDGTKIILNPAKWTFGTALDMLQAAADLEKTSLEGSKPGSLDSLTDAELAAVVEAGDEVMGEVVRNEDGPRLALDQGPSSQAAARAVSPEAERGEFDGCETSG
jgi:hypothetical protein